MHVRGRSSFRERSVAQVFKHLCYIVTAALLNLLPANNPAEHSEILSNFNNVSRFGH